MNLFSFGWGWGWGFGATAVSIILFAIFLIPLFFFLLNLNNLLERIHPSNRAMPPGYVWLNFIPIFNWYWSINTVMKVRDSVKAEYASRGWAADGDFGYSIGMAAAILFVVMSFFRWIPFVGWVISLAWLICWIIYWLKASELKGRLGQQGTWRAGGPQGYPGNPFVPPVTPPYTTQQPWPGARQAPPQQPVPSQAPPQQPVPQQPQQPAPAAGGPAPPVPSGPRPEIAQPEAQPAPAARENEGAPAERGGLCAACGTAYGLSDGFCRTCGMKLP